MIEINDEKNKNLIENYKELKKECSKLLFWYNENVKKLYSFQDLLKIININLDFEEIVYENDRCSEHYVLPLELLYNEKERQNTIKREKENHKKELELKEQEDYEEYQEYLRLKEKFEKVNKTLFQRVIQNS